MAEQAVLADVKVKLSGLEPLPTFNPVIHDQSNSSGSAIRIIRTARSQEIREGDTTRTEELRAEDREVRSAVSGATQRRWASPPSAPRIGAW